MLLKQQTLSVYRVRMKGHTLWLSFQVLNWTPDGQCSNLMTITRLLEGVTRNQIKTGNHPIVVHCRWIASFIKRDGCLPGFRRCARVWQSVAVATPVGLIIILHLLYDEIIWYTYLYYSSSKALIWVRYITALYKAETFNTALRVILMLGKRLVSYPASSLGTSYIQLGKEYNYMKPLNNHIKILLHPMISPHLNTLCWSACAINECQDLVIHLLDVCVKFHSDAVGRSAVQQWQS